MNARAAARWWPVIGMSAMVALGLLVGKRSTTLDDWFIHVGRAHRSLYHLLRFTDPRLLILLLAVAFLVALVRRRWRIAVVVAVTPVIAITAARLLKRLFDREKNGQIAYPSGHVTVTVVVLGLLVLVLGAAAWLVATALLIAVVGLLGQAFTYHYFTDTIGAVFLATSILCLAARAAKLDTALAARGADDEAGMLRLGCAARWRPVE